MTTTTQITRTSPHPLKGIVNTNDDPTRCARCQVGIDLYREYGFVLLSCCGKTICDTCADRHGRSMTRRALGTPLQPHHCAFCPELATHSLTLKEFVSILKKNSKKGHAWAQHSLGLIYLNGALSVSQSYFEAKRWFEKAARQNHPDALHNLGCLYKEGIVGGRVDLEKARDLILSAMEIDPESSKTYAESLVAIASCYLYDGVVEKREGIKQALGILVPLTGIDPENTDATIQARFQLAYALYGKGDSQASYGWYCSAVLLAAASPGENTMGSLGESLSATSTYNAMICCGYGRLASSVTAQRIFWARLAQKECVSVKLNTDKRLERAQKIVKTLQAARRLRDTCGGCGAEFEGKERKFCHGCKAFCYCSRECQKMHWNRKKDGHREDCKGAMDLKVKLKKARKEAAATKNGK